MITLYELADRLNALELLRYEIQNSNTQTMDQFLEATTAIFSTIGSVTNALFTNNVGVFTARVSAAAAVIATSSSAIGSIAASVSDVQNYVNNAVTAETNARLGAKSNMDNTLASLSATVGGGLQQAIADRSNIRSQARSNDPSATLLNQANSQAVVERTFESNDNNTRLNVEASIRVVRSTTVAAAMTSEYTRADGALSTAIAAFSFGFSTMNGSLDETACASRGASYYSSAQGTIYVCTGSFYVPVILDCKPCYDDH